MQCSRCEEVKTEEEMKRDKSRQSGFYPWCKKCFAAYQKIQRLKRPNQPKSDVKRCPKCQETKPITDFTKNKHQTDGLYPYCRECKYTHAQDDYRINGWGKHLKRTYGMTVEDYNALLEQQDGVCAICKNGHEHALCVDHDHETNEIRGLLCKPCNVAIGNMKDDPERLRSAAMYLEMYNLRR